MGPCAKTKAICVDMGMLLIGSGVSGPAESGPDCADEEFDSCESLSVSPCSDGRAVLRLML